MRRISIFFLAAFVLAPDPTAIPAAPAAQACECEPVACHCSGHDHASAHGSMCAFANGGRCGIKSADRALSPFSSRSHFVAGDALALPLLLARQYETVDPLSSGHAGYEKPPTPPPRPQA